MTQTGTPTFGVETDEDVAHRQLDTFVDAGGTFVDTADVYGAGEFERTWRIVDEVTAVAAEHDRPATHVALAWLLTRPNVASVLLGAARCPHGRPAPRQSGRRRSRARRRSGRASHRRVGHRPAALPVRD